MRGRPPEAVVSSSGRCGPLAWLVIGRQPRACPGGTSLKGWLLAFPQWVLYCCRSSFGLALVPRLAAEQCLFRDLFALERAAVGQRVIRAVCVHGLIAARSHGWSVRW
jgi:hypothetical protein